MNLIDAYVKEVSGPIEHRKGEWDDGTPMNYFLVPVRYVDIGGEDEKELLFFVTETQDEEATRLLAESVAPGYHFLT